MSRFNVMPRATGVEITMAVLFVISLTSAAISIVLGILILAGVFE